MSARKPHWSGWVNCRQDGVLWVEVYRSDFPGDPHWLADVWVSGNLSDDIDGTVEDFIDAYGETCSDSIEGFGRGETYSIREVWPK